ncbi:MAG: MarR family transcriptional regulator [Acidobacteriota bacterium]
MLVFMFKHRMVKTLAEAGADVSVMHVRTLKTIACLGPSTPAELAEALQRDKAQITRLVKPLIEQSYLVKSPHPTDKRSHVVALTRTGLELMERIAKAERIILERMTEGMLASEIEQFNALAVRMQRNLADRQHPACAPRDAC